MARPVSARSPHTSPRRLSARFFRRPADELARALLGKTLVHADRRGVIVETEAYLGPEDLASHARFGATERNRVMFGPGGIAYVYLCYGVHEMFNVVSGSAGQAGAVLIRALALPGPGRDPSLARGPGKLTRALGLSRAHNGLDLARDERLYLAPGRAVPAAEVAVGPRVGIDYAGDWAAAPLRFWVADHPAVSRPPRSRRGRRGSGAGPAR
ncbi:DNA-3-methyladenine glycosylase [Haliangium sp.]|uniref:DNA-3-methyladenine glycosylase n=1 Tax=Haliangium sp. TaxID=2663208 RepID=UPI003D139200